MGTLFSGNETAGAHEQELTIPPGLHGTFFVRVKKDGAESVVPVTLE